MSLRFKNNNINKYGLQSFNNDSNLASFFKELNNREKIREAINITLTNTDIKNFLLTFNIENILDNINYDYKIAEKMALDMKELMNFFLKDINKGKINKTKKAKGIKKKSRKKTLRKNSSGGARRRRRPSRSRNNETNSNENNNNNSNETRLRPLENVLPPGPPVRYGDYQVIARNNSGLPPSVKTAIDLPFNIVGYTFKKTLGLGTDAVKEVMNLVSTIAEELVDFKNKGLPVWVDPLYIIIIIGTLVSTYIGGEGIKLFIAILMAITKKVECNTLNPMQYLPTYLGGHELPEYCENLAFWTETRSQMKLLEIGPMKNSFAGTANYATILLLCGVTISYYFWHRISTYAYEGTRLMVLMFAAIVSKVGADAKWGLFNIDLRAHEGLFDAVKESLGFKTDLTAAGDRIVKNPDKTSRQDKVKIITAMQELEETSPELMDRLQQLTIKVQQVQSQLHHRTQADVRACNRGLPSSNKKTKSGKKTKKNGKHALTNGDPSSAGPGINRPIAMNRNHTEIRNIIHEIYHLRDLIQNPQAAAAANDNTDAEIQRLINKDLIETLGREIEKLPEETQKSIMNQETAQEIMKIDDIINNYIEEQ